MAHAVTGCPDKTVIRNLASGKDHPNLIDRLRRLRVHRQHQVTRARLDRPVQIQLHSVRRFVRDPHVRLVGRLRDRPRVHVHAIGVEPHHRRRQRRRVDVDQPLTSGSLDQSVEPPGLEVRLERIIAQRRALRRAAPVILVGRVSRLNGVARHSGEHDKETQGSEPPFSIFDFRFSISRKAAHSGSTAGAPAGRSNQRKREEHFHNRARRQP